MKMRLKIKSSITTKESMNIASSMNMIESIPCFRSEKARSIKTKLFNKC